MQKKLEPKSKEETHSENRGGLQVESWFEVFESSDSTLRVEFSFFELAGARWPMVHLLQAQRVQQGERGKGSADHRHDMSSGLLGSNMS